MVSSTIINAIKHTTYRQDGRVVLDASLRRWSLYWRGFESQSRHFVDITIQSIVPFILNTCTWYVVPSLMLLTIKYTGSMAQWYEELVKGASHFGGVNSDPSPFIFLT